MPDNTVASQKYGYLRIFTDDGCDDICKGYAGYDRHKAEHVALLDIGSDLQAKFHAGEADVTEGVGQLLKGWLANHPYL